MIMKKLIIAGVVTITLTCAASFYAFASPETKKVGKSTETSAKATAAATTEATTEQKKKSKTVDEVEFQNETTEESLNNTPKESTEEIDRDEFENPDEYEDDSLEKCNHDWDTSIAYDSEKGYVWEKTCKKCHSVVTEPATQEEYEKYEPKYDDSDSEYVDDESAEAVKESTEEVSDEELK
jgi:cytochrome c5